MSEKIIILKDSSDDSEGQSKDENLSHHHQVVAGLPFPAREEHMLPRGAENALGTASGRIYERPEFPARG